MIWNHPFLSFVISKNKPSTFPILTDCEWSSLILFNLAAKAGFNLITNCWNNISAPPLIFLIWARFWTWANSNLNSILKRYCSKKSKKNRIRIPMTFEKPAREQTKYVKVLMGKKDEPESSAERSGKFIGCDQTDQSWRSFPSRSGRLKYWILYIWKIKESYFLKIKGYPYFWN